jgi:hypothetical protein
MQIKIFHIVNKLPDSILIFVLAVNHTASKRYNICFRRKLVKGLVERRGSAEVELGQ